LRRHDSHADVHAMSATRILWGQFLLTLGVAVAYPWAATQGAAWQRFYQGELRAP
jgi:hypothetical protein